MVVIGEDCRRPHRPRRARAAARRARSPAAQDRLVLGRQQRHRASSRTRCAIADTAAPRTARSRSGTSPPPAPYVDIEWSPTCCSHAEAHKDAIFLSPHKFIGGPGTPGVLIARRALLTNRVPAVPGGGTVAYVNSVEHAYLTDPVASRRGRHARDRRVDPRRPGLPAQGRRRARRDPRARGLPRPRVPSRPGATTRPSSCSATSTPTGCRSSRSPSAACRCRRRPPSAPQLRRGPAERPVRHPGARRLLVRRPVRPPAAGHRPRPLARVREPHHARLRGHQARLGARRTSTTSSPTRCSTT